MPRRRRTDSTGRPFPHRAENVLLEGATVFPPGDTATRLPVKVQYAFDPPFTLPRPGVYAFFIQDPCEVGFSLYLNRTDDVYPYGQLWFTGRAGPVGCGLSGASLFEPDSDLCFEIEFCSSTLTPTRRTSWGEVKVIYR